MEPPRLVITGRPGIGKTTLFNKIINTLRENGFKIGGIIAPEVRSRGVRVGFRIVDLYSGVEGWLAKKNYISPIRIGRYGLVVDEALSVWRKAIEGIKVADVIGIDEVGPMELKLPGFKKDLIEFVLKSTKPFVLVVHYRLNDPDILGLLEKTKRIVVELSNRDALGIEIPPYFLNEVKKFYSQGD
ncbi:nucleoside-triphosphatase [Desulfurococcaceae archaeon MEX13E-LK6-19]|nr:nucleoside-triphosphatase [Desulfurococcaceae archaeon MEX13E-LK6-19]